MNPCRSSLVKPAVFVFVLGFARSEKKCYAHAMRTFWDLLMFEFSFVCVFCLSLLVLSQSLVVQSEPVKTPAYAVTTSHHFEADESKLTTEVSL